jgi:hypothetical protein
MNSKRFIPSAFLVLIFLISSTGCHSYVKPVDESICTKCVNFIEDGKTKKEEVLKKSDFYELLKTYKSKNDTILIFRFSTLQDHKANSYHLVLIFNENDVLKEHSIVRVR